MKGTCAATGFPFISLNVLQIKAASSLVKASPDSLLFIPHGSAHLSTAIYRLRRVIAGSRAACCPRCSCRCPSLCRGGRLPVQALSEGVYRDPGRKGGFGGRAVGASVPIQQIENKTKPHQLNPANGKPQKRLANTNV